MGRFDAVDGLLVSLVLAWGTAFVAIKVLGEVLNPFELTWYRYAPFLAIYGGWLIGWQRSKMASLSGSEWGRVMICGFLAVVGYHFPLNWGLAARNGTEVSGATGAILVATAPLWTLLWALAIKQETADWRKTVGSVIAFAGVIVVVMLGRGQVQLDFALRAGVILLAPFLWSMYSVIAKPLVAKHGGLFVTGTTMCFGTLLLLPIAVNTGIEPLAAFEARHWFWIVFLTLVATVGGYGVWNYALRFRTATQVTAVIYAIPVVASVAQWILLDTAITPWVAVGGALVLAGVVLINRGRAVAAPMGVPRAANP